MEGIWEGGGVVVFGDGNLPFFSFLSVCRF
jgi:hypothetical protein